MLDIRLIQGDTLQVSFQFLGVGGKILDNTLITSAYITCERLALQSPLVYKPESGTWILSLGSTVTTNFEPCIANYDLTLTYGDVVRTEVYQGGFSVLRKNNKVINNG